MPPGHHPSITLQDGDPLQNRPMMPDHPFCMRAFSSALLLVDDGMAAVDFNGDFTR
jgi:hypothetical protein